MTDGFVIIEGVVSDRTIMTLLGALTDLPTSMSVRRRGSSSYGVRDLLRLAPTVRTLADSPVLRAIVDPLAGAAARPVRGIYFDKTPNANWKVSWHQDLSIAVRERRDVDGFGGWSVKAGVPHVQPPAEILETMLTVRLHLDDTDETNGALRVVPGSHRLGRLSAEAIRHTVDQTPSVVCTVCAAAR